MDEEYKKEKFETLKIKTSVTKKFRRFSRSLSKSQLMTLLSNDGFKNGDSGKPYQKKNKCSDHNYQGNGKE